MPTASPQHDGRNPSGKLFAVGIGPGGPQHRTLLRSGSHRAKPGGRGLPSLPGLDRRPAGREGTAGLRHAGRSVARSGRPPTGRGRTGRLADLVGRCGHLRHGRTGHRTGPAATITGADRSDSGGHGRRGGSGRLGRTADVGLRHDQPERFAGPVGDYSRPLAGRGGRRPGGGPL